MYWSESVPSRVSPVLDPVMVLLKAMEERVEPWGRKRLGDQVSSLYGLETRTQGHITKI